MRIYVIYGFSGSEPLSEDAIQLICNTGGVAVLAHPWALKNPVSIIRKLKAAGLHGMEVYRSDGKLAGIFFILLPFFFFVLFCSSVRHQASTIMCNKSLENIGMRMRPS